MATIFDQTRASLIRRKEAFEGKMAKNSMLIPLLTALEKGELVAANLDEDFVSYAIAEAASLQKKFDLDAVVFDEAEITIPHFNEIAANKDLDSSINDVATDAVARIEKEVLKATERTNVYQVLHPVLSQMAVGSDVQILEMTESVSSYLLKEIAAMEKYNLDAPAKISEINEVILDLDD